MRGTRRIRNHRIFCLRITPAHAGNTSVFRRGYPLSRDHPRTRGEHPDGGIPGNSTEGSPPHTRGTRDCAAVPHILPGITPAHAGNTAYHGEFGCFRGDHPRTRGEHRCSSYWWRIVSGSPPHTRGTLPAIFPLLSLSGITPAHAGNTLSLSLIRNLLRDHPRTRGEHKEMSYEEKTIRGSPPHTRGTLCKEKPVDRQAGITPAHAGNTSKRLNRHSAARDHPRTRGEHWSSCGCCFSLRGSPPHTRGTRYDNRGQPGGTGITPAHAGNTERVETLERHDRDHPRTRGEHPSPGMAQAGSLGSPPHTRGTLPLNAPGENPQGITPAHAGNTRLLCLSRFMSRDHPRTRGEHAGYVIVTFLNRGSPPHTRGTPFYKFYS